MFKKKVVAIAFSSTRRRELRALRGDKKIAALENIPLTIPAVRLFIVFCAVDIVSLTTITNKYHS